MEQEFPKELMDEIPIEDALLLFGFKKDKMGRYHRQWGILYLSACPYLVGWVI